MEPIICKTHNVPKVPMRNKRNAPMLGCPVCHGLAKDEPSPAPPAPPKETAKPKRSWSPLLYLGGE